MRQIILHNHLFKNAGTSVDQILERNFPGRWASREFSADSGPVTAQVADWILENDRAVAFSSHTIACPLPRIDGVRIIPIVLLREPVERIASAYRFERLQDAQTKGAVLAKQHGLAGYVHARLSIPGDRQCRNFQTARLAALMPAAPGTELDRARAALREVAQTGVLGLVADFGGAMKRLTDLVSAQHPDFRAHPITANATRMTASHSMSPEMRTLLEETNMDDSQLLEFARGLLDQAGSGAGAPQLAGTV